jgi:hypothetical protein
MFIKNGSFRKHTHIISYVPAKIWLQPSDGIAPLGSNFTFKVRARGTPNIRYQWYKNGFPIFGANSNDLVITSVIETDEAEYYCEVENYRIKVRSRTAKLNISFIPYIITQPLNVLSALGSNISFKVSAVGRSPFTYQWYKGNQLYIGGTSDNLNINNINYEDEDYYYVTVSNIYGTVTSIPAALDIIVPTIIIKQPVNVAIDAFTTGYVSLTCDGTFPIQSQWRKDDVNINSPITIYNGEVNLSITNARLSDIGYYDCVLSNYVNTVISDKAFVFVRQKPTFIINPLSTIKTTIEDDVYTFTVDVEGNNPITFEWFKLETGKITGETGSSYTISNIKKTDEGNYYCVASNIVGATTSLYAYLSVIDYEYILSSPDTVDDDLIKVKQNPNEYLRS